MHHRLSNTLAIVLCLICSGFVTAVEPTTAGRPESVPLTRDDMKRALDASKESIPRLPLPPVTDEEKALIAEQHAAAAKGEKVRRFGLANNGRMRAYYLPEYGFQRTSDIDRARAGTNRNTDSSLDQDFRTMIFWIVSRGNNCTYCLGHQESSLASRGMTDDQLAALDGDWSEFDEAKRAAFAFASKLSFQPYAMHDQDIAALRKHYNDTQITELILAVAGFNATNRWTGPLKIKQDVLFQFVRPTSDKYTALISRVAPADVAKSEKGVAAPKSRTRPPLESRADVEAALKVARARTPRLSLTSESEPRPLGKRVAGAPLAAQWTQLLQTLPKGGAERITSYQAVLDNGTLDPRTKAIIAYVGARNDRAWYALGHAIHRLKSLGLTDDQIFALDQPEKLRSPQDREVVEFARTITVDPALITDEDFLTLRKLFEDKQVAEIVYVTTQAAFFDRLTEAAGLQLEN
jgi:alkylhydroperoxidase family enzyme